MVSFFFGLVCHLLGSLNVILEVLNPLLIFLSQYLHLTMVLILQLPYLSLVLLPLPVKLLSVFLYHSLHCDLVSFPNFFFVFFKFYLPATIFLLMSLPNFFALNLTFHLLLYYLAFTLFQHPIIFIQPLLVLFLPDSLFLIVLFNHLFRLLLVLQLQSHLFLCQVFLNLFNLEFEVTL